MPADSPVGVPIVGPGAPYITPQILIDAPTGISWSTIPHRNATAQQQYAEQLNICVRATAEVDKAANQPLRATVDVEPLTGPGDFRCQNQPTGVTRLLMSRSPITAVLAGRISAAGAFPRSWQTIPANQFEPEVPLLGVYGTSAPSSAGTGGQAILLAPGWVNWAFGRLSSRIEVTYINGWPHAALTEQAAAGATTLTVDDITGWLGAAGTVYDSGQQELITCTAVTPAIAGAVSGPGTLTLAAALTYSHYRGTLASTLPGTAQQAAIYFAVAEALTRGATATAVQSISGSANSNGPGSSEDYIKLATDLVHVFRRTI